MFSKSTKIKNIRFLASFICDLVQKQLGMKNNLAEHDCCRQHNECNTNLKILQNIIFHKPILSCLQINDLFLFDTFSRLFWLKINNYTCSNQQCKIPKKMQRLKLNFTFNLPVWYIFYLLFFCHKFYRLCLSAKYWSGYMLATNVHRFQFFHSFKFFFQTLCQSSTVEQQPMVRRACYLTLGSLMKAASGVNQDRLAVDARSTTSPRYSRSDKQEFVQVRNYINNICVSSRRCRIVECRILSITGNILNSLN